ncbi:NUDIX hydrolase [Nitratireductor mangrovi]|uniref:NUDIX hydrolase n=1 Tax=Nitratireductor mangrovi TaxID=2599600 RepID=A0A5B8KVP7_9HYPH|nr:NUDIX hydrolase [Nitratireductor mangrovi]QDY99657.1 NUDIX hydrolase [Nitratireductor mangrovi]
MLLSHRTWQHSVDRIRRLLGGLPPRVQVAALPWRLSGSRLEVMLITSRDSGRWVLPKGWPENGELLHESAAREATEEAGLHGAIGAEEIGSYFYGKGLKTGLETRCRVLVFPLRVEQVDETWPEQGERTRKWFTPAEAATKVRESDLAELVELFAPRD